MNQDPIIHFIDDDSFLLDGLVRHVRKLRPNWTIYKNKTPENALEAINDFAPDIVISDFCMPGMDGLELIGRMRQSPSCKMTRFIMLTGSGNFDLALKAINEYKVTRFFSKPFECSALLEEIDACLIEVEREKERLNEFENITLKEFSTPVFFLNKSFQVTYKNPAAEELFEGKDPFKITDNGICRTVSAQHRNAFEEAVQIAHADHIGRPIWLRLELSASAEPLGCVLSAKHLSDGNTVISVMVAAIEECPDISLEAIQTLFELSPAEARLVSALTRGSSLKIAADQCGVTHSSARTYLKRVFQKTGVASQTELVANVYALAGRLT